MTRKKDEDLRKPIVASLPGEAQGEKPAEIPPEPLPPQPPTPEERLSKLESVVGQQQEFLTKIANALTKEASTPMPPRESQQGPPPLQGGPIDFIMSFLNNPAAKGLLGQDQGSLDPISMELLNLQRQGYMLFQKQMIRDTAKRLGIPDHVTVEHG